MSSISTRDPHTPPAASLRVTADGMLTNIPQEVLDKHASDPYFPMRIQHDLARLFYYGWSASETPVYRPAPATPATSSPAPTHDLASLRAAPPAPTDLGAQQDLALLRVASSNGR